MEYGGNLNLKQFIANYKNKNKAIEEKTIKDIIKQSCLGLKDIHDSNLIHRDLKPENIFINEDNEIKVGDFGISKILSTNNRYATTKIGTFYYMAPEVVKGDIYNNKADIYSLGCIIYELFTLNEYYIDKILDKKECKINLNIYNSKWQKLIELLLESDYHQRPTIKEICDYIDKNQIILYFSIKDCSYMFAHCKNLENIDFSSFDTENVTNMKYMFSSCSNLKNIDLSSLNTKNVTNMSSMFYDCSNLENVKISSFDTKNVNNMSDMFYSCGNLVSIDLSSFDTKNVTNMVYMFGCCNKLNNIDLS